jgi:M6 family metalloprotease-like protein
MTRHRYVLIVSASGEASIADLEKDERGFFAITLDVPQETSPEAAAELERLTTLAEEPANTFVPTSACQMPDLVTPERSFSVDLSAGFPKVRVRLPSYGHIKAIIVPIDFSDVPGKDDPLSYFTPVANGVTDFYYQQSYGRLAFDFTIVPNWVRVPFASTKYGTGGSVGAGDPAGYLTALIALTDPQIDYSEFDAVYYLVPKEMPMANMGWGPAITSPNVTSNGVIINGATGGADMYEVERNGVEGARWKWMAHETGHAFGLYDEDLNHESQSLGIWGIMAMSWSNEAIELGAWDRYLQGWLTEDQITCLEKDNIPADGTTVTLDPLTRQNAEVKSVMIPLSKSRILVLESRRNEGLDKLPSSYEGLVAYTVDTSIGQLGGGYVIQPRPDFTDTFGFQDAALRAGDTITVDGVVVTVLEAGKDGDMVKVTLE